MAGRRLKPEERRRQLLDVGAAMFAEKPYEDVFIEDIAARAGVSRALLYHYFPSKRDLYIAIFKRASYRWLARADTDPQLPLAEQLANGLEAHIRYFADHPFEATAVNRGALSDDPAIQAIITDELNSISRRLVDKLVTEGRLRDVTEIAVEGWLAFVRAACVKWVQSRKITQADLTGMCLRAFDCALEHPETPRTRAPEFPDQGLDRGAFGGVTSEAIAATISGGRALQPQPEMFCVERRSRGVIAILQRGRDAFRQIKRRQTTSWRQRRAQGDHARGAP